ncbi:hypothetical protein PHLCEN_2v992 [Hermanssonia centrifuga]|uniref:Uncharacterized protein n=1 Tax=Hermanssonia centrifuga TaxID=98765 RepID=A0A2R6S4H8_9APHY|nr:hypothetical protein PHLCEN_2v992 [Hermanssonia centrifuga]
MAVSGSAGSEIYKRCAWDARGKGAHSWRCRQGFFCELDSGHGERNVDLNADNAEDIPLAGVAPIPTVTYIPILSANHSHRVYFVTSQVQ